MSKPLKRARPEWAVNIEESYELDATERGMLAAAESAWQRWQDLKERIDADGVIVPGRYENTDRAHPLLSQESVARQAFMKSLRALKVEAP